MDIQSIRDKISSLFTADGLSIKEYTVKCASPTTVRLLGDGESLWVKFDKATQPLLSVKKIITISVNLEELYVGPDGGKIKLKNFPDINFTFDDAEGTFGCEMFSADDMLEEIEEEFGDAESRRLAEKCLTYGRAWATMCRDGGTCFSELSDRDIRSMKKQCASFIREQVREEHGSIIVLLLMQFVLPYIIRWVAERIIDRLINS